MAESYNMRKKYELTKQYKWEGHELGFKAFSEKEKNEARKDLKKWLSEATQQNGHPQVYCVLRSVAKSGMSRVIHLFCVNRESGNLMHLSNRYALAMDYTVKPTDCGEGIHVSGCGMDMGFHLVYCLSSALYGDGYFLENNWI